MNAHVDKERHIMFQQSIDEVQHRLETLVQSVEKTMSQRTDEIFIAMRGDYRSVLGGNENVDGEILPKTQRIMQKEIMRTIEGVEKMFNKVVDSVDEEEKILGVKKKELSERKMEDFPDNRQVSKSNDASGIEQNSEYLRNASVLSFSFSETNGVPDNEQIPQPEDSNLGEKSEHLPKVSTQEDFGSIESSKTRPNVEISGIAMGSLKAESTDSPVESSFSENIRSRDRAHQHPSHLYSNTVRGHPSHLYDSSIGDEDDNMRSSEEEKKSDSSSDSPPPGSDSSEDGNDSDDY